MAIAKNKTKILFSLKAKCQMGEKLGWIVEGNSHVICSDKI
jgi:hypothetical protein